MVVWRHSAGAEQERYTEIRGQLLSPNGEKIGGEFFVNSQFVLHQNDPQVTGLDDGGFVVTWQTSDDDQDGEDSAIKAQIFDASGAMVGGEFLVNSHTAETQYKPAISALDGGGFVVTWATQDPNQDGSGTAIKGQVFGSDGALRGEEFLVNTKADGNQNGVKVADLKDGGFVAAWVDTITVGDGYASAVKTQIFDASGAKQGSEFTANSQTNGGNFEVSVAGLEAGGFVATWAASQDPADADGSGVKGQVFSAEGARVGTEFLANSQTVGSQRDPEVTGLADGGFAIAWRTYANNYKGALKAQIFDASGAKSGAEFEVNSLYVATQWEHALAGLPDGGIAFTWMDSWTYADGSGTAVMARVLAPLPDVADLYSDDSYTTLLGSFTSSDAAFQAARDDQAIHVYGGTDRDYFRGNIFAENLTVDLDAHHDGYFDMQGLVREFTLTGASDAAIDDNYEDNLIHGSDGGNTIWGSGGSDTIMGGGGDDRVYGGIDDDRLLGEAGDDDMDGDNGNDTLVGGAGNDTLEGGGGNDVLAGGAAADQLLGEFGDDVLRGNAGDDTLDGGLGSDKLRGGAGSDLLVGGDGADYLDGGAWHDELEGGLGDDTLLGGARDDILSGELGQDLLFGGSGRDFVYGNAGNDTLFGGIGADWLHGGDGDDVLDGGTGNDTLNGGAGRDVLTGGKGSDVFVFGPHRDVVLITDFRSGVDTLDLAGFGLADTAAFLARTTEIGADLVFDHGQASELTIAGWSQARVEDADLLL